MAIWRMHIARCIPRTTNTHSVYVILIAFQLQKWLHERTSMLRYTYITERWRTDNKDDQKKR